MTPQPLADANTPSPFAAVATALAGIAINLRAADDEANFVATVAEYHQLGGRAPTNRAERRRLAKALLAIERRRASR